MTKSSYPLRKFIVFKTLRVLICIFLLEVCLASEVSSLNSSPAIFDPIIRGSIIEEEAEGTQLGFPLDPAGDIDNDRFEDSFIGVPSTNDSQGAAYVVYGGESSPSLDHNLSLESLDPATTGLKMQGKEMSFKKAGDVNNDGYDDIFIEVSSHDQEEAYVISGGERSSMVPPMSNSATTGVKISESVFDPQSINGNIKDPKEENCPINCNRCSSPFSCTECTNPYLLYESQCVQSCPEGSFISAGKCEMKLILDSRLLQIQNCGSYCIECTTTGTVCIDCEAGYVPSGSSCILQGNFIFQFEISNLFY